MSAWLRASQGEKHCLISLAGIRRVVTDAAGGTLRLVYEDGGEELLTCQDTQEGFDVWVEGVLKAITGKDPIV